MTLTPLLPLVVYLSLLPSQDQQFPEREVLDPETDSWIIAPPQDGSAPQDDLGRARSLLANKKASEARKLLKEWVKRNAGDDRYYEGVLLLGETWFEDRDYWAALEKYTDVAENSAGDLFMIANRRAMDCARAFLAGEPRIVWGFLLIPAYDDGLEALNRVWERMPGTRLGETSLKLRADYYYARGDMDLAQDEYANLAREYPSGKYVQFASLRAAEAADAAFGGVKYNDRPLLNAETRYKQVKANFPAYAERENVDERLAGVRRLRAEKDLDIAKWYERTAQAGAAEFYYRQILKDWEDTLAAAEARQRLRALGVEMTEGNP